MPVLDEAGQAPSEPVTGCQVDRLPFLALRPIAPVPLAVQRLPAQHDWMAGDQGALEETGIHDAVVDLNVERPGTDPAGLQHEGAHTDAERWRRPVVQNPQVHLSNLRADEGKGDPRLVRRMDQPSREAHVSPGDEREYRGPDHLEEPGLVVRPLDPPVEFRHLLPPSGLVGGAGLPHAGAPALVECVRPPGQLAAAGVTQEGAQGLQDGDEKAPHLLSIERPPATLPCPCSHGCSHGQGLRRTQPHACGSGPLAA